MADLKQCDKCKEVLSRDKVEILSGWAIREGLPGDAVICPPHVDLCPKCVIAFREWVKANDNR